MLIKKDSYESKRDDMIGGWRNSHNEELHNFYCVTIIIGMSNKIGMRWV
jgi:hypothetical protein